MNNSNNKDVTSGIASIIAIVLFVAGVAFNQLSIEITRPKDAEMKSLEVRSLQNVEARLWQDPFSAAKNHSESESKGNIFKSLEEKEEHKIEKLKEDINKHLTNDKTDKTDRTVTVLGVMVNAGPYAESAEQRRRMRYAVLAGLANESYFPDDGEHIGYVITQKSNYGSLALPEIIPFEWLHGAGRDEKKRERKILILWIAEEYFSDEPYHKLLLLFDSLKCSDCNKDNYKVKVLGPSISSVLRKIINDKSKMEVFRQNLDDIELIRFEYCQLCHWIKLNNYFNIEFYSATTTVSTKFILPRTDGSEECEDEKDAQKKIREIFKDRLFRTIHSDSELAKTLIEELKRREIESGNDTILLLSEWDTLYGRYLPKVIQYASEGKVHDHCLGHSNRQENQPAKIDSDAKGGSGQNDDQGQEWRRYTYLRGLDGDIPASKNEEGKQDKQKNQTAVDQQLSKERPEGTSQLDYIKRLADEIVAEIEDNNLKGKDNRVKAIGLLGSDADDKLILLQALRPKLPGMVFFTTDMDARLIPHGSHDWGRNLIVASSFGLNLNKSYQGGIPPFRDAYQTSTFLATQLAVCDIDTKTGDGSDAVLKAKHELLDKWLEEPPRLFEIGHTEAFNITDTKPIGEQKSEQVCSLVEKIYEELSNNKNPDTNKIPKLNPSVPSLFPREKVIVIFTIMSILVLLMILVTLRNNPLDTIRSMIGLFKASLIKILLFLAIILAIILGYIIITNIHEIYEPFLWFQGISIWPTQIIRFLTVILSFCFLGYSWKIIKKDQDDLGKNFFNYGKESTLLICPKTIENIFYLKKLGDKNLPLPARKLFNRYLHKSRLNYRLIRTFIFFALFFSFSSFLFLKLFPVPDPPARGQATFIITYVLLVASILSFWFLLFFITDAFRWSGRFLYDMTYYTTEWPSDLINRYTPQLKIPDEPNTKGPIRTNNDLVNDWLEVEVTAIHTESIAKLIWYPFIILILLIFSISPFFDNWVFTWSIAIVITFAFIVLILHAWWLQHAAEKLRSDALDHLYEKLIWAKGDENLGAIASQLELLIKQIENLRRGAFQSFLQRPFLKSILALLGSVGGFQLLEYFYR